ncbi:MAG: hypothetical protein CL927_15930 [Deltaproteobacteria bacterium]|nr:hypothetical protein [Deltaproteobacteria bacterium]HCH62277.1 hypothetical protein [Deltaproteobacteria bacterium]
MPRFKGQITRTFTTRAQPDSVAAFLSDPGTWIAHQEEIEHAEVLGDDTLFVRMREHTHGPAKFRGVYRCTWERLPDGARWDSDESSNLVVHGRVRVRGIASGSEVTWEESVDADVPVPRLMVRVVRPVAERLMARGLARFIAQMNAELDRLA